MGAYSGRGLLGSAAYSGGDLFDHLQYYRKNKHINSSQMHIINIDNNFFYNIVKDLA